jgi:AcrR family transcriptional regulator
MAHRGTGALRRGQPTLTAADWAEAATQLIAEAGVAGLTVDALASRLGVTKGSFYWHFRGRADLLAAALARWEQRAITDTMKGLDAMPDVRRRLELILDAAAQAPRARSLYAALAAAADDPVIAPVLARIATARIGYLESCYRALGMPAPLARATAVFAYASYRGLLQLAHEAPATMPADWSAYPGVVRQALLDGPLRPPDGGSAAESPARPPRARVRARRGPAK